SYADHAAWQRARFSGPGASGHLDFWRERLLGVSAGLDLALDRARPSRPSFEGHIVEGALPASSVAAARRLAETEGTTLFAVLLPAFQALLMRASGQPEVVVGTPVAARLRAELEPLVGFFANVLALPGELEPGDDFRRLLRRTWAMVREA